MTQTCVFCSVLICTQLFALGTTRYVEGSTLAKVAFINMYGKPP